MEYRTTKNGKKVKAIRLENDPEPEYIKSYTRQQKSRGQITININGYESTTSLKKRSYGERYKGKGAKSEKMARMQHKAENAYKINKNDAKKFQANKGIVQKELKRIEQKQKRKQKREARKANK